MINHNNNTVYRIMVSIIISKVSRKNKIVAFLLKQTKSKQTPILKLCI